MKRILLIALGVVAVGGALLPALGQRRRRGRVQGPRRLRQRQLPRARRGGPHRRRARRADRVGGRVGRRRGRARRRLVGARQGRDRAAASRTRPSRTSARTPSCLISPQSLIGERFVDCDPTQPRAPGSPAAARARGGPRRPARRGPAPAAPREQRQVGRPRPGQQHQPGALPRPLPAHPQRARRRPRRPRRRPRRRRRPREPGPAPDEPRPQDPRRPERPARRPWPPTATRCSSRSPRTASRITGFLTNARIAGEATAERGEDLRLQLQKFPATLREVRLTMKDLRGFADQGTPLVTDIASEAKDLSQGDPEARPRSHARACPRCGRSGTAAEAAGPKLVASDPVIVQTRDLTNKSAPVRQGPVGALLDTFAKTKGIEYLMDFIYYSVGQHQQLRPVRPLPARPGDPDATAPSSRSSRLPRLRGLLHPAGRRPGGERRRRKRRRSRRRASPTPRAVAPPAPAPPAAAGEPRRRCPRSRRSSPSSSPSEPARDRARHRPIAGPASPVTPAAPDGARAMAMERAGRETAPRPRTASP